MSKFSIEQLRIVQAKPRIAGSRVGRIVSVSQAGQPAVDYPGNSLGPQRARIVGSLRPEVLRSAQLQSRDVLLVFEEEDPSRPVIVDIVLDHPHPDDECTLAGKADEATAIVKPAFELAHANAQLGSIAGVEADHVLLRMPDAAGELVKAKTAVVLRNLKDPVMVLMSAEREAVIIGQIYAGVPIDAAGADAADVVLKGARVRIEADLELVLKAGSCAIELDARGKATMKADNIVSRARDSNKVQGGSVQLN